MNELLLEAYPLTWPEAQPRTHAMRRRVSQFVIGFGRARDDLLRELDLLGARQVIISSNVPVRRDGLPLANASEPVDPGVALYFERKGKPYAIACDTYQKVRHNLRAIGVTVASLRTIERHGSSRMLEQAFTGFASLPAHMVEPSWWDVLEISPEASVQDIVVAHKRLAEKHHPDVGGTHERMARVNRARDVALEERGR